MTNPETAPASSAGAPLRDDDRISGAELQIWLDLLGLTYPAAAALLKVRDDTVRHWCSGKEKVPHRVDDEMTAIDQYTAAAIGRLVDALRDARDVGVVIYRRDEDMWSQMPELEPYGARWWRMVVARASLEVPGVEVEWAESP